MIEKLRSMAVFVRVVETGSFRRAAEKLGLSASVVSHHLTQLESELGVRLLYRSTRHIALTDQGRRFVEYCRSMVEAAEDALHSLSVEQVVGRLWVVAPTPFSLGPFITDVAEFCRHYPGVELQLEFDDRPRNLIQEGIDVAIRFGEQPSSSLIIRPLFDNQPRRYAAPAYLERFGTIETPLDLERAAWITVDNRASASLTGPHGEVTHIALRRQISVNSIVALYHLTLAGMGIAEFPPMLTQNDLAQHRLVELLPEWQSDVVSCAAVYPARAMPKALSRLFVDFIHDRMLTVGTHEPPRMPLPATHY